MKIISLMYHDVIKGKDYKSSGFTIVGANKYKVGYKNFPEQIEYISKLSVCPAIDISCIEELKRIKNYSTVFLTFDDGGSSAYGCIADVLRTYGLKGYFFITAKYINAPGFLSKEQIIYLRKKGHIIGTHSFSHPTRLSKLSYSEILEEWKKSISILSNILGEEIRTASVPGGYCSKKVIEAAREAGIRMLFTSDRTVKVKFKKDIAVLGRYTIYNRMPNKIVYKLASGDIIQRFKQWICGRCKKVLKIIGGRAYLKVREIILK